MEFAQSLLQNAPSPLGPADEAGVDALCRKIDVVKKVIRSYDGDWKKPIDGTALDGSEIEVLISMFLFAAAADAKPDKKFKYLNSAFNALDLAAVTNKDASRLAAEAQLESFLAT